MAAQNALLRQVYADVNHREAEAKQMLEKDPKMALAMLQETRKKVESAGLEPAARDQLLRRLDRSITDTQHYIEQNRSRIELDEKNNATSEQEMDREANVKLQTQQKLAELVDQYNRLNEEQRFEEAEVIAKRAQELAPHEMVTQVMVRSRRSSSSWTANGGSGTSKENGFADALNDVDEAAIPHRERAFTFPDAKNWRTITSRRAKQAMELNRRHRSEKEIEIEKKLLTPVNYSCRNRPLSEVLNQLAKLVNVNIHLDEEGLREEGQSPDTPVTLELASDIQLKSYLNLILEKYHLCYIIKNEVLNITSETKKGDHVYQQVYPVGDLVMPIPNFVASPRMGLAGALHDAMGNAVGTSSGFGTVDDAAGGGGQPGRPAEQRRDQPGGDGQHGPAPARRPATRPAARPRRRRRRHERRLRHPHRPDHADRVAHDVGPQRRQGQYRRLAHELEPGGQPDAGSPRGDRRSAGAVAADAGLAGHDRGPLHHAQRQLLRADRRRLRLQHRQEHRQSAGGRLHGPAELPARQRLRRPDVHGQRQPTECRSPA